MYSHQKMPLNSARLMPKLTCLYSGVSLYFSKLSSHCASFSGGKVPRIGCHSTIDNPERVRRVMPPTTINMNSSVQQTSSQIATCLRILRSIPCLRQSARHYTGSAH